jgi:Tol biopolymer transport system component
MRIPAVIVAVASFLTVAQHDAHRSALDSPSVAVSGDGRYVAFVSYDRLTPADTNTGRDVYVLDRGDGSVTLESLPLDAVRITNDTDHPSISADGRFLVYETNGWIIRRDRVEGKASVVAAGRDSSISGDGRFVAYVSGDDVVLSDVLTHTIQKINIDSEGRSGPGASLTPSVSADGRYVAFTSTAALDRAVSATERGIIGRARPILHVYIRDVQECTTHLVSRGLGGKPADGDSWRPAISTDGGAVAFVSAATNLVSGDRNRSPDVFVADLTAGSIELVSRTPKGVSGNGASIGPAVSADGRIVVFQSEASDLGNPDEDINLLWDVFLLDRRTREMVRVSTDPVSQWPQHPWMEVSSGPATDSAGDVVAFSSRHPTAAGDKQNDFDLFIRSIVSSP